MKRVFIQALVAVALLAALSAPERVMPPPEADVHVQDEAGLFSRSAKTEIATSAHALANLTGAQIVLASEPAKMPASGVLILVDDANKTVWVEASAEFLLPLGAERNGGESYLGAHVLEQPDQQALLLYRSILSRMMQEYGLSSLPRYGVWEKYVAVSRAQLVMAVALVAVALIFSAWLKRRLCPPNYPLEKEGPFNPAHAPDLLEFKPR